MLKPSHALPFLLLIVLAAAPASAGTDPGLPAPADPQQQPAGPPPEPSPESLARDLGIAVDQQTTISRFEIAGNTVYGEQQLQDLLKAWQGTPVATKDLVQAVEALRTHYRTGGFAYADVKVPAQRLDGGALRIEVLEGQVSAVKITGNNRYSSEFLTERIADLAPGKVVTNDAYQRSIILLNTLPGLAAQVALAPSGAAGQFDVNVAVRETQFASTLAADNLIRSEFGNVEIKYAMNWHNTTKSGDTITFEPFAIQRKWPSGFRAAYARPLGNKGTTVNGMFVKADFQFVTGSPLMGLQNNITYGTASVTHPMKMSFARNIFLAAGYVHTTSEYVVGTTTFGPLETLDMMTASVVYADGAPGMAQTNAFAQFSGNFRSNPTGDVNNAQPARFDFAAGHERWFNEQKWSVFAFGIGVLTADPLLSAQKVTIGGPFCVRGFNVNEAIGDQGYLIKTELRRHVMLPGNVPLTLKTMVDHAGVYRMVELSYYPSDSDRDYLTSAGAGASVKIRDRYTLGLDWATPINDRVARDGKDQRFWVTFISTF